MRKIVLATMISIWMTVVIAGCGNTSKNSNANEKVVYTCPMHAEIIRDKLGKCPKCGMELVEKHSSDDNKQMKHDSL